MKVLVLNPNTSAGMARRVVRECGRFLPAAEFTPLSAAEGDAVIADEAAFQRAESISWGLLRRAVAAEMAFDRVLLACFGDPGLEAVAAAGRPVTGLARASMEVAERSGEPYAILTAGAPWQAMLQRRLRGWGCSGRFLGVHVLPSPGLAILEQPQAVLAEVTRAAEDALRAGARRVILGGAVLAGYADFMVRHGFDARHLIDCAAAAAEVLERG